MDDYEKERRRIEDNRKEAVRQDQIREDNRREALRQEQIRRDSDELIRETRKSEEKIRKIVGELHESWDINRENARKEQKGLQRIIADKIRHTPSSTLAPEKNQTPASHPVAAVQEQIITKSCLLGAWSTTEYGDETYEFYCDDSFYFEGFYTGNTYYIGSYTTSGSLLNLEINKTPVSLHITYIDQNTILINSYVFKRVGSLTSFKFYCNTENSFHCGSLSGKLKRP
jgi:hypothetical protein